MSVDKVDIVSNSSKDVTVRIEYSLLDYVVNEGADVIEGSNTERVNYVENWTFDTEGDYEVVGVEAVS